MQKQKEIIPLWIVPKIRKQQKALNNLESFNELYSKQFNRQDLIGVIRRNMAVSLKNGAFFV